METQTGRTRLLGSFTIAFIFLLIKEVGAVTVADCGGFISAGNDNSGQLTSPNSPGNYSKSTKCIWLIEAINGSIVQLNLTHLAAQNGTTSDVCLDYVEIRDGSKAAKLRYFGCFHTSTLVIESPGRWLWLKFHSNDDSIVNSGFTASWAIIAIGPLAANVTSPVIACRNYLLDMTCPNKECVDTAFLCDGDNDCGCLQGCDEDCGGLGYSVELRITIGILIGVGMFLIPFIIIGVIETAASMKKEKKRKEDERARGSKDRKFLNLTMATVQKTTFERSLSSSGNFEKAEFVVPLNTNLLEVPSLSACAGSNKTSTPIPKDNDKVETTVIPVPQNLATNDAKSIVKKAS